MAENPNQPKISVILVDGGYRPHFAVIDSLRAQTLAADDFEILWIEYFDSLRPGLLEKAWGMRNFQAVTLNRTGIYHSALCFNHGITAAAGDLLVIMDADIVFDENFLETIRQAHQGHEQLALYVFRLDEPAQPALPRLDLSHLQMVCTLSNPANYGGCLSVRKRWLLEINGYEQHDVFRTGGDHAGGLDVYTRFKNLGLPVMWHPRLRAYHPWHPHQPNRQNVYHPQKIFVEHRAKALDTLPYQGIDKRLDRPVPEPLRLRLEKERKKLEANQSA